MSIVIKAENLCKNYKTHSHLFHTETVNAIQNISFELEQGSTLAIVGESGSGKTTLAKQLVGIEQPTSGQLFINGKNIYTLSSKERLDLLRKVRLIFQSPLSSLNPRSRIGKILEEPLIINTQLSSKERKRLIEKTLLRVGLKSEHSKRFPHMFSGGQQQRIAIARALILNPSVIVADEPLSALDVSVQAQILNLILELQEEQKISYIFISHDLGVVEHLSDQILVMYHGRMMEYGDVEQIFDAPKHPYTQTLLASTPIYRDNTRLNPNIVIEAQHKHIYKSTSHDGCPFSARCSEKTERCLQQFPKTKHIASRLVTCHTPLN